MTSEIKPTALRIQPEMKERVQAYAERHKLRSLHAATLDALDKGLEAGGFPGSGVKPVKAKVPRKKTFDKITAGLEEALSHANGEEVPGMVIHKVEAPPEPEPAAAPTPLKPSLKDWLGT